MFTTNQKTQSISCKAYFYVPYWIGRSSYLLRHKPNQTMTEAQRLRQVRKALGISQQQIAYTLGLKQGSYSDVERGKASISASLMKRLMECYRVNPTFLLTGSGPLFLQAELSPLHPGAPQLPNVPLVGHELVPAYMLHRQDPTWYLALPYLHLPDLEPEVQHYAFQVRQEAMAPTLYPGDYVVGRPCAIQDVQDNRVYIIFVRDGAWAIRRVLNRYERDGTLILKSDNSGHATYPIPADAVDHLLAVERKISAKLHGPENVYDRLNKLEQELWDLRNEMQKRPGS